MGPRCRPLHFECPELSFATRFYDLSTRSKLPFRSGPIAVQFHCPMRDMVVPLQYVQVSRRLVRQGLTTHLGRAVLLSSKFHLTLQFLISQPRLDAHNESLYQNTSLTKPPTSDRWTYSQAQLHPSTGRHVPAAFPQWSLHCLPLPLRCWRVVIGLCTTTTGT